MYIFIKFMAQYSTMPSWGHMIYQIFFHFHSRHSILLVPFTCSSIKHKMLYIYFYYFCPDIVQLWNLNTVLKFLKCSLSNRLKCFNNTYSIAKYEISFAHHFRKKKFIFDGEYKKIPFKQNILKAFQMAKKFPRWPFVASKLPILSLQFTLGPIKIYCSKDHKKSI